MSTLPRTAALTIMAALFVSGCSSPTVKLCPNAAILADTASLTSFRQDNQADPAGAIFTVSMTGATTDCNFDKQQGESDSSLHLSFRATRPPAAAGANYTIPYFVAVTQGARILSKRNFAVTFTFAPGASVAIFTDSIDSTTVKVANGQLPTDYQMLAGLQLTQAQRDYNQKMGPYVP